MDILIPLAIVAFIWGWLMGFGKITRILWVITKSVVGIGFLMWFLSVMAGHLGVWFPVFAFFLGWIAWQATNRPYRQGD